MGIRDIVAMSCRDRGEGWGVGGGGGGGQHRETEAPLAEQREEALVGQFSGHGRWSLAWISGARGQLCSGLADGQAVCLGVCSL